MASDVLTPLSEDGKCRLARLKNEKGQLLKRLRDAQVSGTDQEHLKQVLKRISSELKSLQKQIKATTYQTSAGKSWEQPALSAPSAIGDFDVTSPIDIRPVGPEQRSAVEAYLEEHQGAFLWHRPVICSFVESTYGHPTRYLIATTEQNRVVGVLPLVQLKSILFGNFIVSMPYFNYGGVVADNQNIAKALLKGAEYWQRQESAQHTELRSTRDGELGFPQRTDKVVFWLPLPQRPKELWDSFKPKLRAQIRRGDKELTEFSVGGVELLEEFYRVFSTNMRDLGTPVYEKKFFSNLLEHLPGQSWIVVARVNGKAAGCAFLTGYKNRLEIPWGSTLKKYRHTSINMSMYWKILEWAIEMDFGVFDFGRCSKNAGTYRFKKQWGAQRVDLHWDYLLPEGQAIPQLSPDNPKYRLLIQIWRRLPLWVANIVGPRIVRFLP